LTIALTMGDPAGVGPEVVVKALADTQLAGLARWVVVGDARILEMAEQSTGLELAFKDVHHVGTLGDLADFHFGRLDARCGEAAVEYVRIATEMCLRGEADAIVTAPLNKEAVTLSGRQFSCWPASGFRRSTSPRMCRCGRPARFRRRASCARSSWGMRRWFCWASSIRASRSAV